MNSFCDSSINDTQIAQTFKLKDSRGWKLTEARAKMAHIKNLEDKIETISYRPFDNRFIFYDPTAVDWGREKKKLCLTCWTERM